MFLNSGFLYKYDTKFDKTKLFKNKKKINFLHRIIKKKKHDQFQNNFNFNSLDGEHVIDNSNCS